jgi:hypothetical protein
VIPGNAEVLYLISFLLIFYFRFKNKGIRIEELAIESEDDSEEIKRYNKLNIIYSIYDSKIFIFLIIEVRLTFSIG